MTRRRDLPLFHWSPIERRPQILRHGLRPAQRSTTNSDDWRAPHVCFADTPSWAWCLSAGCVGAPGSEWDLWQTWFYELDGRKVIRDATRPSGIYEVRTTVRVPKSALWHVGTRTRGRTAR